MARTPAASAFVRRHEFSVRVRGGLFMHSVSLALIEAPGLATTSGCRRRGPVLRGRTRPQGGPNTGPRLLGAAPVLHPNSDDDEPKGDEPE